MAHAVTTQPVIGRMGDNEAIFKRLLDEPELADALRGFYATRLYTKLRSVGQDPTGE